MIDTTANSATGGYLTPTSPPPPMDDDLEDVLQAVVVGITGLPGEMVRPRWQPSPPAMPEIGTDWCAIGVMTVTPDNAPAVIHDGSGYGSSTLRRHASLDVLASFYGPNAGHYAGLLSDGLYIAQNREAMACDGLALIEVEATRNASDYVNTMWRRRIDLPIRLRRRTEQTYSVLNLAGARGTIHYDGGSNTGPLSTSVPFTTEGQP